MLSLREFCIALYLMEWYREGRPLPSTLPSSILPDETLLSLAGPHNASYGNAAWGPTPGMRSQQGVPGTQPMTPTGLRPQMQGPYLQTDGTTHYKRQKARVPAMENSHVNQLSNGEQNSLDSESHEAAETEKKVLYKSRCDNRLNEITERALADKREAELLGKKYEEK